MQGSERLRCSSLPHSLLSLSSKCTLIGASILPFFLDQSAAKKVASGRLILDKEAFYPLRNGCSLTVSQIQLLHSLLLAGCACHRVHDSRHPLAGRRAHSDLDRIHARNCTSRESCASSRTSCSCFASVAVLLLFRL